MYDGEDMFSVSTSSERNNDRVDSLLFESIGYLCLVAVVDGSSLDSGGNVSELGYVSGYEKDFGALGCKGLDVRESLAQRMRHKVWHSRSPRFGAGQ